MNPDRGSINITDPAYPSLEKWQASNKWFPVMPNNYFNPSHAEGQVQRGRSLHKSDVLKLFGG